MEKESVMKNFSYEDEELIRSFIFTNPHGEDSLIYPQSLVAGEELSPLMSAVSRTHLPMQTRTLQFLDREKTEQTKAMLPYIKPMMDTFRLRDGTLVISRKTGNFSKEWVLAHGHGSIKEGTALFGHSENISDITGKRITGHPQNHPQAKSTRYISYGKVLDLILQDQDLNALPNSDETLDYTRFMNRRYTEVTQNLADRVYSHTDTRAVVDFLQRPGNVAAEINKKVEREQMFDENYLPSSEDIEKFKGEVLSSIEDAAVRKDVGKFVLDYSRVYLLGGTKTSLVYSTDARTLEEIITDLISSPRKEDQQRGHSIWTEAKKLAPILLGEKSHVKVDMWKVKNESELRAYMEERFGNIPSKINGDKMVNMITPRDMDMYSDRFNAACVVFPYTNASLTDIFAKLENNDIKEILEKSHKYRGEHEVIHPAISHGGLMFELTMAFHGYRDMFRHRKGSRSTQLLTTVHGFEIPEIFETFGLSDEYIRDMQRASEIYEKTRKISPHVAEKTVPFGALCRSIHSWQVNQVGYIGKLRSDISKGNTSYVLMTREMMKHVSQIMPETAKYFRYDRKMYPAHLWKAGYKWFDANTEKK